MPGDADVPVLSLLKVRPASAAGTELWLRDGRAFLAAPDGTEHEATPAVLLRLAEALGEHPDSASYAPGWAAAVPALPYLPFTGHVPPVHRPALALALLTANALGRPAMAKEYAAEAVALMGEGLDARPGPSAFHDAFRADAESGPGQLFVQVMGRGWQRADFRPGDRPRGFRDAWCEGCPARRHLGSCHGLYGCRAQAAHDPEWGWEEWLAVPGNRERLAHLRKHPVAVPELIGPRPEGIYSGGIDALPPGTDPFSAYTVWFVTWPHGDGRGSIHPATLLPCGEDLLLLRHTSQVHKHSRPGIDVPITERVPTGLHGYRSSAVICENWCLADRGSLSAHGVLMGRLQERDSLAVLAAFGNCFDRWYAERHDPDCQR